MEVLLIDDQAVTVQVYAAIVRRTFPGARVHIALDLSEGLQIAAHRKIDVVLLDLQLQNSVGVQTLRTALETVVAGKIYIPPEAKLPDLKPAANGG